MASLLGALALLPCRAASAQGAGRLDEVFPVAAIPSPAVPFSPPLKPGWWRAITDALDAMRGLRGRRIPPLVARLVDLRVAPVIEDPLTRWQDLPQVTEAPPWRLELRFGAVKGVPLRIEPLTAAVADMRGESGELLGAEVTWPWLVP